MALTSDQLEAYIRGDDWFAIDPHRDYNGDSPTAVPVSGVMVEAKQLEELMRAGQLVTVRMPAGKHMHRFYCLKADVDGSTKLPLYVGVFEGIHHWLHEGKAYNSTDAEFSSDDVLALLNEAANRRRLRLEKAHALQAMSDGLDRRDRRPSVPTDVKVMVWRRDGGRCVECDSNELLEFDHIIPLAMGGSNTMRNLQLLCEPCNNRKGATLG